MPDVAPNNYTAIKKRTVGISGYDRSALHSRWECHVVGPLSGRADTDASAHLVIARDGGIIQLLPFDTIAWHAGQSEYAGRTNLNRYSIGIEMDNAGELHRREGKFYSWFNREYMPDEVYTDCINGRARYWHLYTKEQIMTVYAVCRLLLKAYPIHYIVGHSEITNRKLDPGAAFPLKQFREQLLKINNP